MKEYRVGKVIVLQNDHDETPPIELPLEKPLRITKKLDNSELMRAEPLPFKKLWREINGFVINYLRR